MAVPSKHTLADIAKELGVSKTTVSRAISGKGRIAKDTVQKVFVCIEKYNYKINSIAKGLANSKSYNIGIVLPADYLRNAPFFLGCLVGVCESATAKAYDVLVTTVNETDNILLFRWVEQGKVDGIILTRTTMNDMTIAYLKETDIPFVLVGTIEDDAVVQVDYNHMEACQNLVSILLMEGVKGIAIVAGDSRQMVNQYRCKGFFSALSNNGIDIEQNLVFYDCISPIFVEHAVRNIMKSKADCIVCTDDTICEIVLSILREEGYSIPKDIKIASFNDSIHMESNNPPITAIGIKAEALGAIAVTQLIDIIEDNCNVSNTILDYEIHLRRSTI